MIFFWIILLIFVLLLLPTISMYWQDRLDGKNKNKSFKSYFYESSEQKYAKEIADGTVVIIESKASKKQNVFLNIMMILLLIGFIAGLFFLFNYDDNFAKNCHQIFGLNTLLLRDLVSNLALPVIFLYVTFADYKAFRYVKNNSGFYPPLTSKPTHGEIICKKINDKLIQEQQTSLMGNIVFFSIVSALSITQFHTPIMKLFSANTIYNQKCEAKEYPFDRFHKTAE